MIPKREKGAREERFFKRQSGSNTNDVMDNRVLVLLNCSPKVAKIALKVSANIMEYARVAETVMKVQLMDGILEVSLLIDFSQASR